MPTINTTAGFTSTGNKLVYSANFDISTIVVGQFENFILNTTFSREKALYLWLQFTNIVVAGSNIEVYRTNNETAALGENAYVLIPDSQQTIPVGASILLDYHFEAFAWERFMLRINRPVATTGTFNQVIVTR